MKLSGKLLFSAVVMTAFLSGCASTSSTSSSNEWLCPVIGAGVGAAAGSTNDSESAALGAVGGAILGYLICPDAEPAAEPVAAAEPVCAMTPPPGALLDADGCAFDSDNDGVYEGIDLCLNTPEGVTVDNVGCPLDADNDAIPDYKDLCPGTPEGVIVDEDGCPLAGQNILSLTGVNFAFDKAVLTPEAEEILEQAVAALTNVDSIVEVRVEGHTDSTGPDAYNQKLSEARAQAVVDYLVSRGIDGKYLIPVGMGEASPVASNDTEEGRAANRRVDFVVKE